MSVFARRMWSGDAGPAAKAVRTALTPVSWLFGAAVTARGRRYDRRGGERIPGLSVVSVGNLAVGGTGKTPFSALVARRLADGGREVALLSRGTGGDEVALHRRWNPDVPVIVDADRVRAAQAAADQGLQVVVLDDGFQHRRLTRELDIVLVAAEDPFPGPLLPSGPYREGPEALARAHAVVVTRRTASPERALEVVARIEELRTGAALARISLSSSGWRGLDGGPVDPPTSPVLAVSAIARPDDFARSVEVMLGVEVESLAFRDHHAFSERDCRRVRDRAGARTVVTTEKDATKLAAYRDVLGSVAVSTLDVVWEDGEDELVHLIEGVLG